jgi:hypothetical protein
MVVHNKRLDPPTRFPWEDCQAHEGVVGVDGSAQGRIDCFPAGEDHHQAHAVGVGTLRPQKGLQIGISLCRTSTGHM